MPELKVVLLTDFSPLEQHFILPHNDQRLKLWKMIEDIVRNLKYSCEKVELDKLDFQEDESVNKYLNADIVIMDVTNQDRRPTYMYHKGNRESIDCRDDIVLIQDNNIDHQDAIQDLKTTCKIKRIIVYRYDEEQNGFIDVTTTTGTNPTKPFNKILKHFLRDAANTIHQGFTARYLIRMEKRKIMAHDNKSESRYLWKEICNDIFTEENQRFATPKLITQMMYAFRDIQDYQSMIELAGKCSQNEVIHPKIKDNMMISYLTAFAHSRRNQDNDRGKALQILAQLCETKRTENNLSNDIVCLCGRIYKDKYTESEYQDNDSLEKAIEWYRRGYAANPNIYAGINLLFLLAITTDDLKKNPEGYRIIVQLNGLLGKKCGSLKGLTDYWDVATYFELHAAQHDWSKACQAALHMYLLNPPIWYLKSTINNLKILHRARILNDQNCSAREQHQNITADEVIYSFWIDFFSDAIDSSSTSANEQELPAQIPILLCDDYDKTTSAQVNNIYVEATLQLNFFTGTDPETLVIRILDRKDRMITGDLYKVIQMSSIRSIVDVKRDKRSIILYACGNTETVSYVEVQIYFSSAERRTAFNEKMSKYRAESKSPETKLEFDLEFERDRQGRRIILGQGSFGRVYLAQDRETRQKFAVKEIPPRNPSYMKVLENEIKILSSLNHKNIVSYYGTATDSKRKPPIFQIIMEYIDGGNLAQHLAKCGKFSEVSIRNYTRQILEGVMYLHENKILHRDIKSANILINSKGEIKIADFGTSKRLAGLHLCTEENVGTPNYMAPSTVVVPPMGYGPEVDLWSVGCTIIEMATGKRPFHYVTNNFALYYKLGNEKQSPEIPSDLSDEAKSFLAKCFDQTNKPLSAKELLNHPFCKSKGGIARETSVGMYHYLLRDFIPSMINIVYDFTPAIDRSEGKIRVSDASSSVQTSMSNDDNDDGLIIEPAPHKPHQVSIDDYRRFELANILRNKEDREALIGRWIDLLEQKLETEILDINKLLILLDAICVYLDSGDLDILKAALNQITNGISLTNDMYFDLERSIYLFINATDQVLSSRHSLPPHVLFALHNIIRRICENLVGFIRPDFIPAVNSLAPITPKCDSLPGSMSVRSLSSTSLDGMANDEITSLHYHYRKLTEKNREHLHQLIKLESDNEITLTELTGKWRNNTPSLFASASFLRTDSINMTDSLNSSTSSISMLTDLANGNCTTPAARGLKRSRTLLELEHEHEQLINQIIENRARLRQVLHE